MKLEPDSGARLNVLHPCQQQSGQHLAIGKALLDAGRNFLQQLRVLHPITAAVLLLLVGVFAAFVAVTAERELAAAGALLLLVAVAGAAAGFANSGST